MIKDLEKLVELDFHKFISQSDDILPQLVFILKYLG